MTNASRILVVTVFSVRTEAVLLIHNLVFFTKLMARKTMNLLSACKLVGQFTVEYYYIRQRKWKRIMLRKAGDITKDVMN